MRQAMDKLKAIGAEGGVNIPLRPAPSAIVSPTKSPAAARPSGGAQSREEGESKLADQKAELAEIEARLARMRANSRDEGMFEIVNQAAIARAQELRTSIANLEADLQRLGEMKVAPQADGSSIQRLLDLAQRTKDAIMSLGAAAPGGGGTGLINPTSASGGGGGGRGAQQASVTVSPTFNISGVANAKEVADLAVSRVRESVQSALRESHRDVGFGYG
jgi:hypothetical protein